MANEIPYLAPINMHEHKIINAAEGVDDYDVAVVKQLDKVKVDANDTSAGYLADKLIEGHGIEFTHFSPNDIVINAITNTDNLIVVNATTANYEIADFPTEKVVYSVELPANAFNEGDIWEFRRAAVIEADYNSLIPPYRVSFKINGLPIYTRAEERLGRVAYNTPTRYISDAIQRFGGILFFRGMDVKQWYEDHLNFATKLIQIYQTIDFTQPILFEITLSEGNSQYCNFVRHLNGYAYKSAITDTNGYIKKIANLEL